MKERKVQSTGIRIWDGFFYVTQQVEGELKDWPANLQDKILKELEKLADDVQLPIAIIHSRCDVDYGDTRVKDRYYLHVVVSEIVAGRSDVQTREKLEREIRRSITGGESIH